MWLRRVERKFLFARGSLKSFVCAGNRSRSYVCCCRLQVVPECAFFASKLLLGPNGVEEIYPVGLLSEYEKAKLEELIPMLQGSIKKARLILALHSSAFPCPCLLLRPLPLAVPFNLKVTQARLHCFSLSLRPIISLSFDSQGIEFAATEPTAA